MKRIGFTSLAMAAFALLAVTGAAFATPAANGVTIEERTFNDCPISVVTTVNNYPNTVAITDAMDVGCVGYANLHSWTFSADGGVTPAVFDNNSNFWIAAELNISGAGEGEAGLRVSPWWSQFVDGRFMVNVTNGEIACFGGRLPFYSFTASHGLNYVRGTPIRLEIDYRANGLSAASPATIQYKVVYNGNPYSSPVIAFDEANPAEDPPHGLWGMLNDARVGAYFQARANTGVPLTATWSNIRFVNTDSFVECVPAPNAASLELRTFNDCPISTVTTNNSYPALVEITDAMDSGCVGWANLHSWSFSEDGGATAAVFNDCATFRFGANVKLDGAGEGEGGLRVSPWYGKYVDGRFMANVTNGEVACFGGRLPFYSFTANHGVNYVRGTWIRMEVVVKANGLSALDPATMEYIVTYNSNTYTSGPLPLGEANPFENPPYGLFGILNDARVGGYFQPRANTGASLTASWGDITFTPCTAGPLSMKFKPGHLNLKSKGKYVTVYLDSAPYAPGDLSSFELNGVPASSVQVKSDHVKLKFPRPDVAATLTAGDHVAVTLTGAIGNECFEATDYIRVKAPKIKNPHPGAVFLPGAIAQVEWDGVEDLEAPVVDLMASYDGGETWSVVASGIANDGAYAWTVPSMSSNAVRLAIVTVFEEDETGIVTGTELAESEDFTILSSTGVGAGDVSFAIRGVTPNPARGAFALSLTLPDAEPADIGVFDVNGRSVETTRISGVGLHTVMLGRRATLPPGVYLVRVTRLGQSLSTRAVVIN